MCTVFGSFVELAYLYGMDLAFSMNVAHDAIVSHLFTGAQNHANGELCHAVRSRFRAFSSLFEIFDLRSYK